jgi:hypothetical protein
MIDTLGQSALTLAPVGASATPVPGDTDAANVLDFQSLLAEMCEGTPVAADPELPVLTVAADGAGLADAPLADDFAADMVQLDMAPANPQSCIDPICAELLRLGEAGNGVSTEAGPVPILPDLSQPVALGPDGLSAPDADAKLPLVHDAATTPVKEEATLADPDRSLTEQGVPQDAQPMAAPVLAPNLPTLDQPKPNQGPTVLSDTDTLPSEGPTALPISDTTTTAKAEPEAEPADAPLPNTDMKPALSKVDAGSTPLTEAKIDVATGTNPAPVAPAAAPAPAPAAPAPTLMPIQPAPVPMTSPNWPAAVVAGPVMALVDAANGSMVLDIAPDELGKLTISLSVQGDVATVRFQAETPEAARILADAERHLAAELARFGMSLAGHEATSDRRQSGGRGGARKPLGHEPATGAEFAPPRAVPVRLVNLLA